MQTRDINKFSNSFPLQIPLKLMIVAIFGLWVNGCSAHPSPAAPAAGGSLERHEYAQVSMGMEVRLVVYAPDEPAARAACRAAYDRINEIDDTMSDYNQGSELMRLCARAGTGPVKVSDDLFAVLSFAEQVSEKSDGAFDVTVGPVVALWRTARKTQKLPEAKALDAARALVGWKMVKLDRANQTAELLKPGMKLDLGGIAKGCAGDEAIHVLRQRGISSAMFEAGGDIVVSAAPPGTRGWVIELPSGEKRPAENCAISTSGDTVQYVEIAGRRYSHVVDPHTGLGLSEHFIATVIAPHGLVSDPLSKVATILGPGRGEAIVRDFGASCWIGKSK